MAVDMVVEDVEGGFGMAGPSTATVRTPQKTSASSVPLHRIRFVDWQPSAISAIAMLPLPSSSTRQSNADSRRSVLAVGRENGNIDLCKWVEDNRIVLPPKSKADGKDEAAVASSTSPTTVVAKGWVVDTTLVGSNPSKVESIAFILSPTNPYPTPRLFSTSGGAVVTEHFLPPHLLALQHDRTQGLPPRIRYSSTLTSTTRSLPSQGGSIWSMAASPLGKHLAIGCEDGVVRIVDIEDGRFELLSFSRSARRAGDGTLSGMVNSLDRARTRIVSLAWGPPKRKDAKVDKSNTNDDSDESDDDDDDDAWENSFILGGTTQSSALVWSTQTGRVTNKLLVDRVRREQSIVWSVATLPDGTCVLGDSLGHVSFFDAKTYTLLQGAKFAAHGRNADVLALCVGSDGRSVYSASVDQKVIEYALLGGAGRGAKWVNTGKRRLHAHDIRAIAIDPPYNPRSTDEGQTPSRLPILVSGGVDFHLVLTPATSPSTLTSLQTSKLGKAHANGKVSIQARKIAAHDFVNPISSTAVTTFADTIHRRLPFVPSTGRGGAIGGGSVVRLCRAKRWLILRREKSVAIWKVPESAESGADAGQGSGEGWMKVLEIQAKTKSNLVTVEISDSGRWLLVSDLFETKLFELIGDGDDVIPKRLRSFTAAFQGHQGLTHCPGASAACFTPDDSRAIIASQPGSYLHVVDLPHGSQTSCKLIMTFSEHRHATSNARAIAGKMARASLSNGHTGDERKNGTAKRSNGETRSKETYESDIDDEEVGESEVSTERNIFSRIDIVGVSPDGQYVVSVDSAKRIHCFSLDTLHHHGVMPSPAQQPNALAFNPWHPSTLCCVLPTNQVVLYDLDTRRITDGSSGDDDDDDIRSLLVQSLNDKLSTVRDSAVGAFWLSDKVAIVWGASFMCTARHIMREKRINESSVEASSAAKKKGKRSRRSTDDQADAATPQTTSSSIQRWSYWRSWLLTKYQPLLFVGTVPAADKQSSSQEMVVVERPYYDVSRSLPPTWFGGASYGS